MVFVVAEIGINWDGDLELLKKMMIAAKNADCDAIKLQSFTEKHTENHPEKLRLLKSSVTEKNIEQVNNISKEVEIEWFCTPMYPESVKILNPYVSRYKIRESDSRSLLKNETSELIEKIVATGKEIIVSTEKLPKNSKYYNYEKIKWLYCIPKYPTKLEELDFSELKEYQGYSNHSPEIIVPLTAVILGAKIIEVHITSDKSKDFIDNPVSFDFDELKKLVKLIRLAEIIRK